MAFAHEVGSSLLASSGGAGADGPTQDAAAVKRAGVAVEWLTLGLRLSERFDREGGERERERRAYSLAKIRVRPFDLAIFSPWTALTVPRCLPRRRTPCCRSVSRPSARLSSGTKC